MSPFDQLSPNASGRGDRTLRIPECADFHIDTIDPPPTPGYAGCDKFA